MYIAHTCHLCAMQAPTWARVALPRGLVCHVASTRVPHDKITPFCPFLIVLNNFKIKNTLK